MRLLFNIALVATTLLVVDAFGFGGKYRHIIGRELQVMNPFKHTAWLPRSHHHFVRHAHRSTPDGR
jgi:hypothetical protein